jgi:hypothetical protein
MIEQRALTADQSEVIDEIDHRLRQEFAIARLKLERVGISRQGPSAHCLVCACSNYVTPDPTHPGGVCQRLGCGHSMTKHYVL